MNTMLPKFDTDGEIDRQIVLGILIDYPDMFFYEDFFIRYGESWSRDNAT